MDYRQVLQTGTVLDGKYRIERVIGSGGFGITYEAFDIGLAAPVAVKEYYPSQFGVRDATFSVRPRSEHDREIFERLLASFLREARTLNQFEHPAIVRVLSVFEAYGTAYMVMKYETGPSLKAWLGNLVRLPTQNELDRLLVPLLDALEMMHNADFLHRDIAPDNIIVRADGSPVLLDFGASRRVMGEMTGTLTGVVKKGYSPQEQYATDSRSQGPWTDIYALGATLYRCVSGETPYEATERMLDDHVVPALEAGAGRYRPEFLSAIDAAMILRPRERPQSIPEWRDLLFEGTVLPSTPQQSWPSVAAAGQDGRTAGGDETRHWEVSTPSGSQPRSGPRSGPRSAPSRRPSGPSSPALRSEPSAPSNRYSAAPAVDEAPLAGSGGYAPEPARSRRNVSAIVMVTAAVAIIGAGLALGLNRAPTRVTPAVQTEELERRLESAKRDAEDAQRRQDEQLKELQRRRDLAALQERERQQREEQARLDRERQQREEQARLDRERQQREEQARVERDRQQREEQARLDRERQQREEQARLERDRQQREEQARLERDRQQREEQARLERDRQQREEQARRERERLRVLALRPRQLAFSAPGSGTTAFPVAVQTDTNLIVAGGSDGGLRVWDAANGAPRELSGTRHGDTISSIAISPDGQRVVSGAWGGEIILWSLTSPAQRFRAADSGDSNAAGRRWVVATEFLSATQFVSVLSDGTMQTWDVRSPGRAVSEVRLNAPGLKSADIARGSSTVATGTDSGVVSLFRVNNGQAIRQLPSHNEWVLALAFAGNTGLLGSGSADGIVRILNTSNTGQPVTREIQAHNTAVRAITFSGDGSRFATGGDDGTVNVWDTSSGSLLATYRDHRNSVRSLTLSNDGMRLVSASEDGDVRVWYLETLQVAGSGAGSNTR